MTQNCPHANLYWYPAINEDGWMCADCLVRPGEPPGFSPELDRSHLYVKVDNLLRELMEAKLVHVSNSSEGDWITREAMAVCRSACTYDQYSILAAILGHMAKPYAEYWKSAGERTMEGKDNAS